MKSRATEMRARATASSLMECRRHSIDFDNAHAGSRLDDLDTPPGYGLTSEMRISQSIARGNAWPTSSVRMAWKQTRAESSAPPWRPTIRVPPALKRTGTSDLWSQRGRKPMSTAQG